MGCKWSSPTYKRRDIHPQQQNTYNANIGDWDSSEIFIEKRYFKNTILFNIPHNT